MVRKRAQANKLSGLPNGISKTWRQRENRQPYLEYLVNWRDDEGKVRIKHFYVGVAPTKKAERLVCREAVLFRKAYEAKVRAQED